MYKSFLNRFIRYATVLIPATGMLLLVGPVDAQAAKPPPTPLSCSISPANGTTAADVPITFTGSTQGGKGSRSYLWNFSAGGGSPASATTSTVNVTYSTVGGPFAVLLNVTDGMGANANCSTTVTVTGSGGNTPPMANNDSYSTVKNTALNVSAPGVLGNDTDTENNPLTAVLDSGVFSGTLALNANGSFVYTPNDRFHRPGRLYLLCP